MASTIKDPLTLNRRELSNLYDQLYARASKVFEGNPCKISKTGCVASRLGWMKNDVTAQDKCCLGCKHLGPKGCTVKALTCKLWVCPFVKLTKEQRKELNEIRETAVEHCLYGIRESKQEIIDKVMRCSNRSERSNLRAYYWQNFETGA